MSTDLALKKPITDSVRSMADRRANNFQQDMAKGIPCYVTKVDKDFVEVSFEPQNGIWTLPTRKIPQAFSPYGRDPTQVGDKGTAVPGDYYLGTSSGDAGGPTSFFPRGNLTPLVFHPMSHTNNEQRDYDQYTVSGGPNGVMIKQKTQQQQNQQPQTPTQPTPDVSPPGVFVAGVMRATRRVRTHHYRPGVGFSAVGIMPADTSGAGSDTASGDTSTSPPPPPPVSTYEIDKTGKHTLQNDQQDHKLTVDATNKKITAEVPFDGAHFVFLGGDGKPPGIYAFVATTAGPSPCVKARIA